MANLETSLQNAQAVYSERNLVDQTKGKGVKGLCWSLTVEFMETIWYQDLLSIYQCFLQKYLRNKGGYNK